MAATIKIKNSSTTGAVPTASDLVQGELAVNVTDLGLYTENASGTIVKLNAPSIDDKGTGATKRLTIDTSGNLGLGVTPSAWSGVGAALQVGSSAAIIGNSTGSASLLMNAYYNGSAYTYINTAAASRLGMTSGAFAFYTAASGTAGNAITFTQAMTLDASGNLGVGTTSPNIYSTSNVTNMIGVQATGTNQNGLIAVAASGSGAGGVEFGNATIRRAGIYALDGSNLGFYTNSTNSGASLSERARIDSSGNLLVGTTSSGIANGGFQIQPAGNGAGIPFVGVGGNSSSNSNLTMAVYSTALSQYQFYVGYGGTVYARSTSITGLSDQREKENIRALDVGLNEVLALQPRRFDWKDGSTSNVAGFVAQEVETILPDLVEEYRINDDGETRFGLKMGDMIPVLVKAIQELNAKFEAYKATHP